MALSENASTSSEQSPSTTAAGGANQVRVRAYNERLVLSHVRRNSGVSKAEIARLTGLSAQTVSVIMRALEKDGLLIRGKPVRGRVGQPSVPMHLNPDAVLSFGVKIGRRSADLVLMDFVGKIRLNRHLTYPYPNPTEILAFLLDKIAELEQQLSPSQRNAIAGVGIAAPFELWNWAREVGAPEGAMEAWRGFDLQAEVAARVSYPVYLQNDATSACGAELVFGVGPRYPDFVFLHRLLHRRRYRAQFLGVRRPHRNRGRNRPAAGAQQAWRDPAAAGDRLDLRARTPAARARHRPAAALV
jgi:DNA-binding transcriptional ArsR family regulator